MPDRPLEGRSGARWERNRWVARAQLQAGATAPNNGKWQPPDGLWPCAVTLGGRFDSIQAVLLAANTSPRPDDNDNSWPIIYTFIKSTVFTITQPFDWIKLQILAVQSADPAGPLVNCGFTAASGSTD